MQGVKLVLCFPWLQVINRITQMFKRVARLYSLYNSALAPWFSTPQKRSPVRLPKGTERYTSVSWGINKLQKKEFTESTHIGPPPFRCVFFYNLSPGGLQGICCFISVWHFSSKISPPLVHFVQLLGPFLNDLTLDSASDKLFGDTPGLSHTFQISLHSSHRSF